MAIIIKKVNEHEDSQRCRVMKCLYSARGSKSPAYIEVSLVVPQNVAIAVAEITISFVGRARGNQVRNDVTEALSQSA